MIPRGIFRSASFRFGAIYALLLAVSATVLALFLWWATAGLLARQTEAAINADAQSLAEPWASPSRTGWRKTSTMTRSTSWWTRTCTASPAT
jgi:hypothetical protein